MTGLSLARRGTIRHRASGPATLASDSFNRADNFTVMGTADTGQAWTFITGGTSLGISSNKAKLSTTDGTGPVDAVDCGATDLTVSADIAGTRDAGTSLVFRCTDATQFYMALVDTGTTAKLYKRVSSTFTLLASMGTIPTNGTGFNFKVDVRGSAITFYVNGSSIGTTTDSAITTGTLVGIRTADTTVTFDNFLVTA